MHSRNSTSKIDFDGINRAALRCLPVLLARWLPDGRRIGHEWTARNPQRADQRAGSFRINLKTGKWADFATQDKGGDVVSLLAYLTGENQADAACTLAGIVGVDIYEH